MDLIERYLAAIGRNLPGRQAADIESELRDVLLSRVEEKEAELGRPLERPEVEALLVAFGHPLVVAGRYRKTQHLIGPEVFPFWLTTIQWGLVILAIVYVVLTALGYLARKPGFEVGAAAPPLVSTAIFLFGAITLTFAAFERFGKAGFLRDWKPSRLPPADRGQRRRSAMVGEIGVDVVFILWWLGVIHFKDLFPYPVQLSVALAPVWAAWRWPILVYAAWEIAANLLALARPAWTRTNTGLFIGRYLYFVAILGEVFQAGHWVTVSSPVVTPQVLAIIQANFDLGMRVGIGITILGVLARVGQELWRAYRRRHAPPAAVRA
jgi:hypothetical protein